MIILLSVFNGFEGLVKSMYNDFDPDIIVEPVRGKVFDGENGIFERVSNVAGVYAVSGVLEDNALLEYRGRQYIATLRGVDEAYGEVVPIESMVRDGEFSPTLGFLEQALVGQGVAYSLGVRSTLYDRIYAYVPKRGAGFSSMLQMPVFNTESILPSGTFMLDVETDSKYVITPIDFTRRLFDYPDSYSALMLRIDKGTDADNVRDAVARELGDDFAVKTRFQQKASIYRIMAYEKWGIFFIILMVLVIASFSVIGSLTMLIIDKRKDIRTLVTLGANVRFIRSIFVREGMLIALAGSVLGLVLGLVLCFGQQLWGWIRIPAETFLVDSYPVVVKATDVVGVCATVVAVSWIIAKFAVVKMIPKSDTRI